MTCPPTVPTSLPRAYALALTAMERRIEEWKARSPWLHAGTMASRLLARSPTWWRLYQAGIAAGYPSEFQKPRRIRTARDRAWHNLEQAARRLVATSDTPLTLRAAVMQVVQTPEGRRLYHAYTAVPARRPPLTRATTRRRRQARS